jgi:hypothetical protein
MQAADIVARAACPCDSPDTLTPAADKVSGERLPSSVLRPPLSAQKPAAAKPPGERDIVFVFIGGGSEFGRVKKWAAGNPRVLCLPYQPLEKLAASLSAADAHLVIMGDAMLGLVHPCKIYNIFAVVAPVVYVGPEPSHVTEAMAAAGGSIPFINVRHGEAERLAGELLRLSKTAALAGGRPASQTEAFSARRLVPQLAALLENTKLRKG